MNTAKIVALLGLAVSCLSAFAADGQNQQPQLTLSSEIEYSTGKYGGSEATDILYIPLAAKYESGPLILKLTIPYVEINGSGNVQIVDTGLPVPLLDGASQPLPSTPRSKNSGLGDIVASVSYNVLYSAASGLMLDLGSKIKFATASQEKGLGTGQHDFGVQADAYQSLGRATTLIATLGYTWMGKLEGSNFRNVAFASAGMTTKIDTDTTLSGFLDLRQSVLNGRPAPRELSFYLTRRLDKNWKIQIYALAGMSDASPQKGIGTSLGYSM
jgi:hypothetical protein